MSNYGTVPNNATVNNVIQKYKDFLTRDNINELRKFQAKTTPELLKKAYSLAFKNYSKKYAEHIKNITSTLTTFVTTLTGLLWSMPSQPPCPILDTSLSTTGSVITTVGPWMAVGGMKAARDAAFRVAIPPLKKAVSGFRRLRKKPTPNQLNQRQIQDSWWQDPLSY